jgi:hypothetical protein
MGAAVAEKIAAVDDAMSFSRRSRGQIDVVGDLIAPINADWNVDEDL